MNAYSQIILQKRSCSKSKQSRSDDEGVSNSLFAKTESPVQDSKGNHCNYIFNWVSLFQNDVAIWVALSVSLCNNECLGEGRLFFSNIMSLWKSFLAQSLTTCSELWRVLVNRWQEYWIITAHWGCSKAMKWFVNIFPIRLWLKSALNRLGTWLSICSIRFRYDICWNIFLTKL